MSTVITAAESRFDEAFDARNCEAMAYWRAYLDGARAQREEDRRGESGAQ